MDKRCSGCKVFKPVAEFSKDKTRPDGLVYYCKACRKAYQRVYRATESGKASQHRRDTKYQATKAGKESKRRCNAKYRERHPEKTEAQKAVNNAITAGKLPRPDTLKCTCKGPAKEYHHHKGYAPEHWFDVVPKCTGCHRVLHTCLKRKVG